MDQFLSLTIIGLSTGAIYAIGASGLVLTYTTTGIFNFAHGAIGMFGAFLYWQLRFDWGIPTPIALVLVLLVFSPLLGIALELVVMRNLQGTAESTRLVITISLLAATIGAANWIWEPGVSRPMSRFFQGDVFELGPTTVSYHEAITIGVAIAVAVGLRFLLFSTRIGVAMRASVDDRPLAEMNGARPDAAAMLAWSIGCSSATLAGILIAPALALSVPVLSLLIVNAYAAAMIGRLRSLPMTFVGAIIVGLVDAYLIGYQPDTAYLNGLRAASPVLILFIALMALPQTRLRTGAVMRSREWFPRPTVRGSLIFSAVVFGGAIAISPLLNNADSITAARVFAFALIVLSFVPLIGFAGQVSLCQLSFAGHRRGHHGPPRPRRESPRSRRRRGGHRRGRRAHLDSRAPSVGDLPRPRHGCVRRHARPVDLPPPRLRGVRSVRGETVRPGLRDRRPARTRTDLDRFADRAAHSALRARSRSCRSWSSASGGPPSVSGCSP